MLKISSLFLITILAFGQCEFVLAQDHHERDGVVKLFSEDRNVMGAGSIIKVDEETRTAYILTAYHVIEGIKGAGSPIHVEFHVDGDTLAAKAKANPKWQQAYEEAEKDGFAVVYVEDYPEDTVLPVIFIDAWSEEADRDEVTTFGYDYLDGTLRRTEGPLSLLKPITLRYDAGIVRPGFSGGPVLNQEGFMIGTNLKLVEPYKDVFAIRAKVFKPVVDEWINGLPRMRLEVSIDDPLGAKDGTVSTEQEFTIKASAREYKDGNLIAPKVKVTLNVPEGYQIAKTETMAVSLHKEGFWEVKAPDEPKVEHNITVNTSPEAKSPLKPIHITTVKGAALKSEIIKPKKELPFFIGRRLPKREQTLFIGEHLDVQVVVKNSGDAKLKEPGALGIEFPQPEFHLADDHIEKTFVVDEPINWRLRAESRTPSGNIVVRITSGGKDENGMPAKIIEPSDSIFVKVKYVPRWYAYIVFPSVLFQFGKEGTTAVEAELGAKVRALNLLRRGIPVYVVMSGAYGIDNIIDGLNTALDEDVTHVFKQQHVLATFSLAIALGPIGLQAGLGGGRYLWDRDFGAWHVATGIEVNLAKFSIQGGIRHIYHNDLLSLCFVQMKF